MNVHPRAGTAGEGGGAAAELPRGGADGRVGARHRTSAAFERIIAFIRTHLLFVAVDRIIVYYCYLLLCFTVKLRLVICLRSAVPGPRGRLARGLPADDGSPLARGDTLILIESDSSDSKVTV